MKKKAKGLTEKERAFVAAFIGEANGNATEAARLAGYGKTRRSQGELGFRLLKKVEIQRAIVQRTRREEQKSILTAEQRDELLSEIARDQKKAALIRISAVKELNKCTGRHSMKHLHEGKLTLEQVLGASRQP